MVNVTKLQALVGADDSEFQRVVGGVEKRVDQMGHTLTGVGRRITLSAIRPLATALGAGLAASVAVGVRRLVSFDEQMRNVNSIAKQTEAQLKATSAAVRDLAVKYGKGATDLAGALYDINSSGFMAAEGLKVLDASALAARAGVADVKTAADGLTTVLNAYGLSADHAGEVTDILFKAVDLGKVTISELAQNLGGTVATAAQAGVSIEQVAAGMATMTKGGINAAEAATALNRTIIAFLNPSKKLSEALKRSGYESGGALLQAQGLAGAVEYLAEVTGGSADELAQLGMDARALKAAMSLARQEGKVFAEDLAAISDSAGAAQSALEEQMKSFAFQFSQAKETVMIAVEEMLELFSTDMEKIAKAIKNVADWFRQLPDGVKKTIAAFGALFVAAGPVLWILGQLVIAMKALGAAAVLARGLSAGAAILELLAMRASTAAAAVHMLTVALRTQGVAGLASFTAACGGTNKAIAALTGTTGMFTGALRLLFSPAGLIAVAIGGLIAMDRHVRQSTEGWRGLSASALEAASAVNQYAASLKGATKSELLAHKYKLAEDRTTVKMIRQDLIDKNLWRMDPYAPPREGWINRITDWVADVVTGAVKPKKELAELNKEIADLDTQIAGTKQALEDLNATSEAAQAVAVPRISLGDIGGGGGGGGGAAKTSAAQEAAEALRGEIERLRKSVALAGDTSQTTALQWDILFGQFRAAPAELKALALELSAQDELAAKTREGWKSLTDEIERLKHEQMVAAAQTEEDRISLDRFEKKFGELTDTTKEYVKQLVEMERQDAARVLLKRMRDGLEEATKEWEALADRTGFASFALDLTKKSVGELTEEELELARATFKVTGASVALTDSLRAQRSAQIEYLRALAETAGDDTLVTALSHFSDALGDIGGVRTLEELRAVVGGAQEDIAAAIPVIRDFAAETRKVTEAAKQQADVVDAVRSAQFDYLRALAQVSGDDTLMTALTQFSDALGDISGIKTLEELRGVVAQLPEGFQNAIPVIRDFNAETLSITESAERQAQAMQALDDLLATQASEIAQLTGKWTTADSILEALNLTIQDLTEEGLAKLNRAVANAIQLDKRTQLKEFLSSMEDMFASTFESIFTDGFGSFFQNVLTGFERLLQEMAAKYLASQLVRLIIQAFGGDMGWLGGVFGGGKALGGPVRSGVPYVVGERGPELFVPQTGGQIVPGNRLAAAGAGMTVNFSFNITTPNPEAFRRSEAQLLDEAGRRIQTIMRRNG